MDVSHDELAGVSGMFGGLTREELVRACEEMAFRRSGETPSKEAVLESIYRAIEGFQLVAIEGEAEMLFVPGPAAFPTVSADAEDLPHIMEVGRRDIDRTAAANELVDTVLDEIDAEPDEDRLEQLWQVSYDLEAWAPVTGDRIRERIEMMESSDDS